MDLRAKQWNNRVFNNNDQSPNKIQSMQEELNVLKEQIGQLAQTSSARTSGSSSPCWYDGVGTPETSLGDNLDYYLQIDNCDIYKKVLGSWDRIGNIQGGKGEIGDTGTSGSDGLNGYDGRDGATWHDGIGHPPNELGMANDYYLDVYNGDIYKNLGYWERIGNVVPSTDHLDELLEQALAHLETHTNKLTTKVETNVSDINNGYSALVEDFEGHVERFEQNISTSLGEVREDYSHLEQGFAVHVDNLTTEVLRNVDNMNADYESLREAMEPTPQDIEDIMNMITI